MKGILIVLTLIATALTFYSAFRYKSVTIETDIGRRHHPARHSPERGRARSTNRPSAISHRRYRR